MTLTAAERGDLLRLARAALEDALGNDGAQERALAAVTITPSMRESRAVFVSLHTRGADGSGGAAELRGCIGTLDAQAALYTSVLCRSIDAGLRDPRFTPVTAAELTAIEIEISVLTLPRPVAGPAEIELGVDGVELEHGAHRAVFLPQVATEQGWEVEELLRQLARKAGLDPRALPEARLSVFRAEVFGEHEPRERRVRV